MVVISLHCTARLHHHPRWRREEKHLGRRRLGNLAWRCNDGLAPLPATRDLLPTCEPTTLLVRAPPAFIFFFGTPSNRNRPAGQHHHVALLMLPRDHGRGRTAPLAGAPTTTHSCKAANSAGSSCNDANDAAAEPQLNVWMAQIVC
jgi:hypothetical protein